MLSATAGAARRYERILDAAGEGVAALDSDTRISFVNPSAARLLGFEREELLGKPFHATVHYRRPDGSPFPQEECPGARSAFGEVVHLENDLFWRKDGTPVPVEWIGTPIFEDGAASGIAILFRDITERLRGQAALRESEERLRRALAAARMGVWEWDLWTGRLLWSPETEALYGVQPGTFSGRIEDFLERIHPADRPRIASASRHMGRRRPHNPPPYRVVLPDGRVRWLEGRGRIVRAPGAAPQLVGTVADVTERVSTEQRLAQQARQVARLEEREQIAIDLHDTIIQSLYGVSLLLEGTAQSASADADQLRETMLQARSQVAAAVRDLRNFIFGLRPPSGTESLAGGLRSLGEELRVNALITPTLRLSAGVDAQVDPEAIPQVLAVAREAVANVIRHAGATAVVIRLRKTRAGASLAIADNGCGFTPSAVARRSGLRSMQQRAAGIDGRMRVVSRPGRGTTVRLSFPLRPVQAAGASV